MAAVIALDRGRIKNIGPVGFLPLSFLLVGGGKLNRPSRLQILTISALLLIKGGIEMVTFVTSSLEKKGYKTALKNILLEFC